MPMILNQFKEKGAKTTIDTTLLVNCDEASWIEFPIGPIESLVNWESKIDFNQINLLTLKYHSISKFHVESLPERCDTLEQISLKLRESIDLISSIDSKLIQSLEKIASQKKAYLQLLIKFYAIYNDNFESIKTYFETRPWLPQAHFSMKNTITFNPSTELYYGRFWVEAVDPCHRDLAMYRYQWEGIDGEKPRFFLWLEDRLAYTKQVPFTRYIKPDELEKDNLCHIHNGLIYLKDENMNNLLVDYPDGENKGLVFVQTLEGKLFLANPKEKHMRHSSLSHGKPVEASGLLWADKGKIQKIFFMSGHYAPNEAECLHMLKNIMASGVLLDTDTWIQYFLNGDIETKTFGEFKATYCLRTTL